MFHLISESQALRAKEFMANWLLATKVPFRAVQIKSYAGQLALVVWLRTWTPSVKLPLISNGVPITYGYAP